MGATVPTTQTMTEVARPPEGRTLALHREILLASDASPAAAAATRVVDALAARWSTTPHVCTVVPTPPLAVDPAGVSVTYLPAIGDELRNEVSRQLAACSDNALGWPREMAAGAPAAEILRSAESRGSDLIVLGLR